jgi:Family of unknown function (DUF5372)
MDPVLIVHPFHVLAGRRLPVLFARRRGREVVLICEGGPVGRVTVPESWTDRVPAPVGHRLSVEALVELDTLVQLLEQR